MVYILLGDGFEEVEAITPVDYLRRAGVRVTTVGITGKNVKGRSGITVVADVTSGDALNMISMEKPEMVVLPGGATGVDNLDASPVTDEMLESVITSGGYIAAICAAPKILGERGILKGRKATCYPGYEKYLTGAFCLEQATVVDGKIITGRAAGSANEFSFLLIEALRGADVKKQVEENVVFG